MSKRWSKLQQRLYNLMDESVGFQIHCAIYKMNSNFSHQTNPLPRYFITIGEDVVWDYPRQFDTSYKYGWNSYPWDGEISDISQVIENYVQRPESEIMDPVDGDMWGLVDILRVCDRRVGRRRLEKLLNSTDDEVLRMIIGRRLYATKDC